MLISRLRSVPLMASVPFRVGLATVVVGLTIGVIARELDASTLIFALVTFSAGVVGLTQQTIP